MAAQASQSEVPGLRHNLPLCVLVWRGRVWYHAYTRVVLLQSGVLPNQIAPRHHHYYGLSQIHGLTNQVTDYLV